MLAAVLCLCWCLLAVHTQELFSDEDDKCKQQGDSQWPCMKLSECPQALADLKKGKRPVTCSFIASEPLVCCQPSSTPQMNLQHQSKSRTQNFPKPQTTVNPDTNSATQETIKFSSKSKQKCEEYAKAVYMTVEDPMDGRVQTINTCGVVESQIAKNHANPTQPRAYPHMALIGYGGKNNITWLCGGSLISERFVLGSARCIDGGRRGPAKWVRLGDHDIASMKDDDSGNAGSREYELIELIPHPEYTRASVDNDIALYKLVTDVQFSEYIRPICLHTEHQIAEKSAIYSAWDKIKTGEEPSSILMEINLDIIGGKECNDSFSDEFGKKLPNGVIESSMLCSARRNEQEPCSEDSGGPLQVRLQDPYCMYTQLGVESYYKPCVANSPTIFTRVSHYVSWIEKIAWP